TTLAGSTHTLFPVFGMDKQRNLYATWVSNCSVSGPTCFHVYYSYALASDWTIWSPPQRVDAPPSLTAVMPWMAAGNDGIIDIVWYGTTNRREDPSSVNNADPKVWYTFMAQVSNAHSTTPNIIQSTVSPHPSHYNSICLQGTGCIASQGDRNLA